MELNEEKLEKLKEIKLNEDLSACRIKFDMKQEPNYGLPHYARIYKNGELQGNPGTINSFIGDTEILIGRWRSINYFAGRGAQYRIYNRALTASEVLQNFDAQRARYEI